MIVLLVVWLDGTVSVTIRTVNA
uniref:Uncharacterized protein n=1 Tax=Anguilla anguilla TaxID=7936 RepID=A0A0E9TT64_ANGAN